MAQQLHKFGGSSLANHDCYRNVLDILTQYSAADDLVVVSAAGKTTNHLLDFIHFLEQDGRTAYQHLQEIRSYQVDLIQGLLTGETADDLITALTQECSALAKLTSPLTHAQHADVLAHGELWSARLLAALLNQHQLPAINLDARTFLRAEAGPQPEVDRVRSAPLFSDILAQYPQQRVVITGFIAQNSVNDTVLLGRNGSDYSATIIGALANVERVTIWSDVAGVYSADPRLVNEACLLPLLRLDEANELARLAAPVLHSRTLQPVVHSAMELHLRSSHQPEAGSTRIERILASGRGAKIITSLEDVLLIELTLPTGQDFTRQQHSVLAHLQRAQLEPLAFEIQADQHRLRLAYTRELANDVFRHLQDSALAIESKLREGYSLLAAVGAGVTRNAQHNHGFYQQLQQAPVEFIHGAPSELSLVAVLRQTRAADRVVSLHQQLFQAQKRVALALCGKGNIGSSWLKLFSEQQMELEKRYGMQFSLVSIIDSQQYWFDAKGIAAHEVTARYQDEAQHHDGQRWIQQLSELTQFDEVIVLDVTASETLANQYLSMAQHGFHLISANKVAGSANSDDYHQVKNAFSKIGRHWLYNATVGAGLPINHTVRDLRESGDEITALSGIFSGTLSWLFQQFDGTTPFSELVELAWQQGLTEPDPRHDLDGSDVMRKLVILAREVGLVIEPQHVKVESLVPDELAHLSLDEFLEQSHKLNQELAERLAKAQKHHKVLRYVARLEKSGRASVTVEAVEHDHPLASLRPCDNVFAIESKWYRDNPLVIRGPGAGREVTAGAIQSDLNRLASLL